MLLATAASAAALALASPGAAFALPAEHDGGRDDSSYSKEHDSDSDREDKGSDGDHDKDYGNKRGGGGEHDGPRGGMHTGGGALAAVRSDDWGSGGDSRFDPENYRDKGHDSGEDKGEKGEKGDKGDREEKGDRGEKSEWGGGHDKPRGGMHTGGGALATPGVTAGGLAVLAVGAAGAYALRRKKAVEPAA
jgi:hypothetical protein